MNPRKEVAEQIKADNSAFTVLDYPATLPLNINNGKVRVSVYRTSFEVNDNNSQITHNLKVEILISRASSAQAEDELDAVVDKVMLSLERMPDVYWQEAKRYTESEKFDAYEISLIAIRKQVYKSQTLSS
ncbi:hypothetical protein ACFUOZ_04660 [Paenarthrobacter sp. NPDC057355]|uniref:hypothetical protein n=1 Tax=Paenarthrobacter sp. NPDC057355 TaxID=3346105 RepID=UPI0036430805